MKAKGKFANGSAFIAPNNSFGYSTVGAYTCVGLQSRLIDYFGKNAAQYRTLGEVALLKWMLSPQNTANFTRLDVTSVPGKKRPVVMRINNPYCFELCQTSLDCTDTPVFVDHTTQEVVFNLEGDPFRHCVNGEAAVLRFSEDDLRKYCDGTNQGIIQDSIARYLLRFEQALDKQIAAIVATKVGHNGNDDAITNIPLWVTNSTTNVEAINPNAVFYLNQLFTDMGQDGQYAMLGGLQVNKLAKFNQWRNNNEMGVDMSKTDDLNPYMFYSRNLESVLGQSDFLLAAPGTIQLVTWNEFKGEFARKVTELYTHGTVVLPTTGIEIDYEWTYDYKCKMWIYEAKLYAEVVSVPAGGCGANLQNVNGIIRLHDCSGVPVIPVCPAP